MRGLKLIHASEKGPWYIIDVKGDESNVRVLVTLVMTAHGGPLRFTI